MEDVATGQLIVVNAGTNPGNIHDLTTDIGMVMMGASTQWPEAAATLRAALRIAQQEGIPLSQISATGHSLGGAHAQLQAVQAGIHAETFNPYGGEKLARELRMDPYALDRAEARVINHRMYHDPVSPVAEVVGRVVAYMDRTDYQLHRMGGLNQAVAEVKAAVTLAAHDIANFWDAANNRATEVFTHNYLHDLHRTPPQDRPNGLPLDPSLQDFRWGVSPDPRQQSPSPRASDAQLFEHLVATMRTGDEDAFWRSVTTVAHADSNREFRAQAIERVDTQDRERALALQVQQSQEQLAAAQTHASPRGFSR
jgi:hypothetical protein